MHILTPKRVKDIVKVPDIAWPTLLVVVTCYSVQGCIVYGLYKNLIHPAVAVCITVPVVFAAFTPMHDAAHGSIFTVASGYRPLNDVVGIMCGLCFPLPFYAFKYLHLQHHKHTNDIEKDPDAFIGVGSDLMLLPRMCMVEYKYYSRYIPLLLANQRPVKEGLISMIMLVAYVTASLALSRIGYYKCVLYGWILPGRVAVIILAYAFDYLPHRPTRSLRAESEYLATNVTALYGTTTAPLTWPLLHQNYHNIHHLVPFVPFYQYSTLWHAVKKELIAHGTAIKPILGYVDVTTEGAVYATAKEKSN